MNDNSTPLDMLGGKLKKKRWIRTWLFPNCATKSFLPQNFQTTASTQYKTLPTLTPELTLLHQSWYKPSKQPNHNRPAKMLNIIAVITLWVLQCSVFKMLLAKLVFISIMNTVVSKDHQIIYKKYFKTTWSFLK